MSWKNTTARRRFLGGLGVGATLPFLETVLGRKLAHAQSSKRLARLVIVSQSGFMYDFMGHNAGKRPVVDGPIPTVNQYLQTVAAAFGLTAADWSPAGARASARG